MKSSVTILLFLGLMAAAGTAAAEDIQSCKSESDTAKRLACFDAVASRQADVPEKKEAPIKLAKASLRLVQADPRKRIYSSRIELIPTFTNETKKTVVALEHTVVVTDAFGDKIIDGQSRLDIKIPPGKTVESTMIYTWEDNEFIKDQPFDKLQGPVSTGVAKAVLEVKRAVFSDGSTESYQ
ncbi:hypothetical protein [Rhizobium rhizogenes]|uniref:hypothetical protein n=1 Tax=Rhizobium rhizogenes TaxID=359 RepID=UPI0024BDF359|nr:hypothetical protein [Rhizobium rhizogenes]MDJ1632245.1 hypothetical protein [Rhizobium rhizogenes]